MTSYKDYVAEYEESIKHHYRFIGIRLQGYCGGFFGRDSYTEKVIVGIGANWIVVEEINDGELRFATFKDTAEMISMIEEWQNES